MEMLDQKCLIASNTTQRKQALAPPMRMEDTMDRPNDPGGSSSTSPPIIIVPDIPAVQAEAPR
eukprot:14159294-Heterocapsa_arctica.AAC.1